MRRIFYMLAGGLVLVGAAIPQDLLPPGVLLLSRIKRHVKEELDRLPNISCLETVQREYKPARGKVRPLDTVRLEVLTNGDKELFASPGDRKFSEEHPISYVGSGALGNGLFGLYLRSILVNGKVSYEYKGEEEIGGRRQVCYDYRLPLMWSGQIVHLEEGSGTVGIHGSFWADPQTFDVIRLELSFDDFPPTLPLTEAVTSINYARTSLGDNTVVLLPVSAEFRMVRFSGEMSRNRIDFTHCRLFGAQSTVNFGSPDSPGEPTPRFAVASTDDTLRPLPAGLQIAVKLRSRIFESMTVGALIEGVVAANVPAKRGVAIAAGSRVRGRVRRLERSAGPPAHFVIALEFTEVELEGIRYRFYGDLVEMDSAPGVERILNTLDKTEVVSMRDGGMASRQSRESIWLPSLPGVATFFLRGARLDLPQGFRTVWKTRPLAP